MAENEVVKINDVNEEELIDRTVKNKHSNIIIIYSLFGVIIFLIIGGVILLLFSLKGIGKNENDLTKKNEELVTAFFNFLY